VAITIYLGSDGQPLSMILDFVELPRSPSGVNLAEAFAQVLKDFGIEHKVHGSESVLSNILRGLTNTVDTEHNL
jgi:hypothetical protein